MLVDSSKWNHNSVHAGISDKVYNYKLYGSRKYYRKQNNIYIKQTVCVTNLWDT